MPAVSYQLQTENTEISALMKWIGKGLFQKEREENYPINANANDGFISQLPG